MEDLIYSWANSDIDRAIEKAREVAKTISINLITKISIERDSLGWTIKVFYSA